MRLQIDLIQALDKHRRGPKQTVDVHIHSGAQGVVGIVPSASDAERPMSDARRTVAGSSEGQ
jgi:hypothetical protein